MLYLVRERGSLMQEVNVVVLYQHTIVSLHRSQRRDDETDLLLKCTCSKCAQEPMMTMREREGGNGVKRAMASKYIPRGRGPGTTEGALPEASSRPSARKQCTMAHGTTPRDAFQGIHNGSRSTMIQKRRIHVEEQR